MISFLQEKISLLEGEKKQDTEVFLNIGKEVEQKVMQAIYKIEGKEVEKQVIPIEVKNAVLPVKVVQFLHRLMAPFKPIT